MCLFQVGSTGLEVKQKVNGGSLVGGGFKDTKVDKWGPLRWSQTTTKGGGVAVMSAAQGRLSPCS